MAEERRYEILGVLGQGGFGTVYHARLIGEGGFTKEVALKVLNPELQSIVEIASRLRDEARVLGLVRHRAIVGVDLLTQLDGRWTVVMEYVEGWDCNRLLQAGPLPLGVALEVGSEIAGALHAAYSRLGPGGQPLRLLHRDLKPSNIRITPFGEVKVLDFGIARAEFENREAKTRSLAFGTPEYMAPERLDFSGDSAAVDIYALGCVLFELITARQLGRTSANPQKHVQRLKAALQTLEERKVPATLRTLIGRMLAFDPIARPTAVEVERTCASLARGCGGVSLREWVDGLQIMVVAAPQEQVPSGPSALFEQVDAPLDETVTRWEPAPRGAPPPSRDRPAALPLSPASTGVLPMVEGRKPAQPTPSRSSTASGSPMRLLVFLLALLMVGLSSGAILWLSRDQDLGPQPDAELHTVAQQVSAGVSAPEHETDEKEDPTQDEPKVAEGPIKEPVVDSPKGTKDSPSEAGNAKKGQPPKPQGKNPPPKPTPVPTTAEVTLTGDAESVILKDSRGKAFGLPGPVPPGTYEIRAMFDDYVVERMGQVVIERGQKISIHCSSSSDPRTCSTTSHQP